MHERRAAERFPLYLQIDYLDREGGLDLSENLSATGAFIRTDRTFKVGERLPLVVSFPPFLGPISITVEVVRLQPARDEHPAGVGVRVPPECLEDLKRLEGFARAAAEKSLSRKADLHVLVVEDNALLAKMYSESLRLLSDARLKTELVNDGAQALVRLRSDPLVDLLITDLYMPNVDGFEVIREVRAMPRLKHIPIVALSAASAEDELRARQLGANLFVRKPANLKDLLLTVRTLLNLNK